MRLEIVDEKGHKRVDSVDQDVVVIGRSSQSDIQVIGEGISRKHLTIEMIQGKFYVTDHGSLNGVYVNEERLPAQQRVEVVQFFPIRIGVKTTISILSDEVSREIQPKSIFHLKTQSDIDYKLELKHNTRTKTKAIPQAPLEVKKSFSPMMYVIGFFILLGIYFLSEDKPAPVETPIVEEVPPTPTTQAPTTPEAQANPYAGLNSYKQKDIKKYLEAYKTANCSGVEEKKLCDSLEFQVPLERVGFVGNELFLFTDYRIHRSSSYLIKFDTKTEPEILELWLARLAIKSQFELGRQFEKVVVVQINAQGDNVQPLVTHSSWLFATSLGKIPDEVKSIDQYINSAITISLDEKIRPYLTHINYFGL
jgi:hypothetical protein